MTPEEETASKIVDALIAESGADGATLGLLQDAHRCLRSYVARDTGLMLEIGELLKRRQGAGRRPAALTTDALVAEIAHLHKLTGRGDHGPLGNLRCVLDAVLSIRENRDETERERKALQEERDDLRLKLGAVRERLAVISKEAACAEAEASGQEGAPGAGAGGDPEDHEPGAPGGDEGSVGGGGAVDGGVQAVHRRGPAATAATQDGAQAESADPVKS
jgi:hypothetical protein